MGSRYAQLQNLNKKLQEKAEKKKRDSLKQSVVELRKKSLQLDKQFRTESALSARDMKQETNRKRAESVSSHIQDSHVTARLKLDQRRASSRDEFKKYKSIQRFNLQMNKAVNNLVIQKKRQEEKQLANNFSPSPMKPIDNTNNPFEINLAARRRRNSMEENNSVGSRECCN